MFPKIRKRFTYANISMTLAVMFAMSGGAYAANRYLITSTKQISPKVLKALKGVNGKNGAGGATGPAGSTGPAGAAGPQGTKGETGAPGKNGTTGFTETLPSKKTETGAWSYSINGKGPVFTAVSFAIPLAAAIDKEHVHYIGGLGGVDPECPGTVDKPEAEPGNLCVYQQDASGVEVAQNGEAKAEIFPADGFPPAAGGQLGASATGAGIFFTAVEGGIGIGTWAVTAP